MLSTAVATIRFFRALAAATWDPASRGVVILAALTLATGTFFYRWSEGWGYVDALYFSVTTLTTIGFGDLLPSSTGAKLFTIMYSFIGIGIIAAFITSLTLSIRAGHEHDLGPDRGGGEPAD
jgi:voltage-gated potassium channel